MVFSRKNNVKNTTIFPFRSVFDLISPPLCRGCGREGGYLCERCKKYIISNVKPQKIMDERKKVRKIFREAEFLGFRDEILGELVEEYKYSAIRGMSREIAEIVFLDFVVPFLEKDPEATETILCPMPTSRKHIRERGFDHIYIVAKRIEKMAGRKIEVRKLLLRAKDTTQVGASEEMRQKQAKEAVRLNPVFLGEDGKILEEIREKKVILFDDVWTTGASMREAGEKLRRAGVKNLYGLTVTKNRYQKSPLIRGGELF